MSNVTQEGCDRRLKLLVGVLVVVLGGVTTMAASAYNYSSRCGTKVCMMEKQLNSMSEKLDHVLELLLSERGEKK